MSALREERRARQTGGLVQLVDARESDAFDEDEGGRWVTYCVRHETFVQHERLEDARWFMADPKTWCGLCHEGLA